MNIRELVGKEILFFDGAMGSLLQKKGLRAGELPEIWNLTHREEIIEIHCQYLESGANIIKTNTFGANRLKYNGDISVDTIVKEAISNAREAIQRCSLGEKNFVALDIGPTGKLLKPFGDLDFEDAVSIFGETVRAGCKDADLILIETMNDLYETKAAVIAAKENSSLPIFVTNAYELSGKLMTGASPETVCAMLEALGVDAIGLNCSFGPRDMIPVVEKLASVSSVPLIVNPNAGLPTFQEGKSIYSLDETQFALYMKQMSEIGVHIMGGCCGTTPAYIKALVQAVSGISVSYPEQQNIPVITSASKVTSLGEKTVIIGDRINPNIDKGIGDAIVNNDIDYILDLGSDQESMGADIIDINIDLSGTEAKDVITEVISEMQTVTSLPLRINTKNTHTLEAALRIYNGKALVNLNDCNEETMRAVFYLIKKYGGVLMARTPYEEHVLSEHEGGNQFIAKLYKVAEEYGIEPKNIIADTLVNDCISYLNME